MSEEPKPEVEFADLPGPPRNSYATLGLGITFGIIIGFVLTMLVLPRLSPTVELEGTVLVDNNGAMILGNTTLRVSGIELENLQGYRIVLEGTMIKLRLGWEKQQENWPLIGGFAP